MAKQVKLPLQLDLPHSIHSTFYTGKIESAKSSTNPKRKYKIGLLPSSPSELSITKVADSDQSTKQSFEMKRMRNSSSLKQLSLISSSPTLNLHHSPIPSTRHSFLTLPPLQLHSHRRSKSQNVVKEDDSEEYLRKLQEKTDRQEGVYADEDPKKTVGLDAVMNFYSHYKKLDKVVDQNKHRALKDSIYTTFLRKEEELQLFPSKIGIIKDRGEKSHILIE